ncbi:MAG: acyltransferase [Muribaculaceae bacterium]|nr:acyltransferase [Muribaculaceae bacterium]MDE6321585.1 acyltransferase [Muribaculaceae bacterium]
MCESTPPSRPSSERHYAIDTLKCIAAFLVVVLHYGYVVTDDGVGRASFAFNALTRLAVPLFFMITGFYFVLTYRRGRVKHQVKRLLCLTGFAVVLYAIFEVAWYAVTGHLDVLIEQVRWHGPVTSELGKLFIFNEVTAIFHLWYLLAAIYAVIAMWAFEHWKLWSKPLIAFFLVVMLYAALLSGYSDTPYPLVRNFLTIGIPCMLIGRWIYEYQLNHTKGWLTSPSVIFLGILLAVTMVVVQMLMRIHHMGMVPQAQFDLPVGAPMLAAALLMLAIRFPMLGRNTVLPVIGAKYSGYIYVFHVIPGTVLRTWIHVYDYLSLLAPVLVFAISLVMAIVWVRIKSAYPSVRLFRMI